MEGCLFYKLPPSITDRSDSYSRPIFEAEIEQTEDIPQEVTVEDLEGWGRYSSKKEKKKKRKGTLVLEPVPVPEPTFGVPCLRDLSYPLPKTQSNIVNASAPTVSDVHEMFLAHASPYVFADKWGVDSLKELTLSKLHQVLSVLSLDASNVQDLVDLARYIYSDERNPGLEHRMDKLRELICYYIAANGKVISSMLRSQLYLRKKEM